MTYELIKAVHIISVMAFIGGLLLLAVTAGINNSVVVHSIRRWDRRVTTPALALVWVTGTAIAMHGQWFGEIWLSLKLIAVVGLSGLHAVLTGTLRRIELDVSGAAPRPFRQAGLAIVTAISAIVFLVILKPA